MISTILSILLFIIFIILGGFHFYWLFGGKWGLASVIPSKSNIESSVPIPKSATLIVAIVLVLFGLLYLVKSELIVCNLPHWITVYGYWLLPVLFIIRAIGDFRYVGFFKKIKNTKFAKSDTQLFVPLCTLIGLIGLLLQIIK